MISEKKFMSTVKKMEKLGYESISHRLFENMRHDVLMEKNNINVYKDIAKTLFSWLDRWNDSFMAESAAPENDTAAQSDETVKE